VFLHSYEPDTDPDGSILTGIMGGPVVVAHWISSQYAFSTMDPATFGAGSKPWHNVIGRFGVAEADGLDLRIGLPLESVWYDGRPIHEPMRLHVVVDAPADRVDRVIASNPMLTDIVGHGWALVTARSDDGRFVCRGTDGSWSPA